mmetsp:Transcript_28825/g.95828  ORF Transcript_28825/g.95828 Transcript_28825/m.95828 type:complete len:110 (-) Transcript_28825:1041-1370(-)
MSSKPRGMPGLIGRRPSARKSSGTHSALLDTAAHDSLNAEVSMYLGSQASALVRVEMLMAGTAAAAMRCSEAHVHVLQCRGQSLFRGVGQRVDERLRGQLVHGGVPEVA